MTTAAIHQPQYLPYLGFFHKVAQSDVFVVMDDAQFQRRGVQHRNRIKTSAGEQWLTVPVTKRGTEPSRAVQISATEPWQRRHVTALRLNYARASYHADLGPSLYEVLERPWTNLCELSMATTSWIMDALEITTPTVYQSELGVDGRASELLANLSVAVGADHYLSGPGGKEYMELDVFEDAGVEVVWQEFVSPTYPQLFPEAGFIPDLSAIDAILCCGSQARAFVR